MGVPGRGIGASGGSAALRANKIGELVEALRGSTRKYTQHGHVWDAPDPHAQDILQAAQSRDVLAGMADHLERAGVRQLAPLSGGFESVVLDGGDRVVKLGLGAPRQLPSGVYGVLPYESSAKVGPFRVEVQQKADVVGPGGRDIAQPKDVMRLEDLLSEQGWDWGDAAPDNMGFLSGQPVVIDGNVVPAGAESQWPLRRRPAWPKTFYPAVDKPPSSGAMREAQAMQRMWSEIEKSGYAGPRPALLEGLLSR